MAKQHNAAEEQWFKNKTVWGALVAVAVGMFIITTGVWRYYYELKENDIAQGNQLTITKTTLTNELSGLKTQVSMMRDDLDVMKKNQREIFEWIKDKESSLGKEKEKKIYILPDGEFRLSKNGKRGTYGTGNLE